MITFDEVVEILAEKLYDVQQVKNSAQSDFYEPKPWAEIPDRYKEAYRSQARTLALAVYTPIARDAWDACRNAEMAWRWAVTVNALGEGPLPEHPPHNPFS